MCENERSEDDPAPEDWGPVTRKGLHSEPYPGPPEPDPEPADDWGEATPASEPKSVPTA